MTSSTVLSRWSSGNVLAVIELYNEPRSHREGGPSARSWPRIARGGVRTGAASSPDLRYTARREDSTMRTDLVPGNRLPDLELPDHRRRPVRLSALANGYPLLVSFYRGYW